MLWLIEELKASLYCFNFILQFTTFLCLVVHDGNKKSNRSKIHQGQYDKCCFQLVQIFLYYVVSFLHHFWGRTERHVRIRALIALLHNMNGINGRKLCYTGKSFAIPEEIFQFIPEEIDYLFYFRFDLGNRDSGVLWLLCRHGSRKIIVIHNKPYS